MKKSLRNDDKADFHALNINICVGPPAARKKKERRQTYNKEANNVQLPAVAVLCVFVFDNSIECRQSPIHQRTTGARVNTKRQGDCVLTIKSSLMQRQRERLSILYGRNL